MQQAGVTTVVPERRIHLAVAGARDDAPAIPAASEGKLDIRKLTIIYGQRVAVRDIDLRIPAQAVTAIIGPSGSGKSTLLRALNRMHDDVPGVRVTGEVLLDGQPVYGPEVDPVEVRRRIGMVFQRPNPFAKSIFDNVAFGLTVFGTRRLSRREVAERVERALRQAALWDEVKDRLHQPATSLSGGQQQRLCVARALAVEPDVVLLDEPTSALDPIATGRIEQLMRELVEEHGYTVVVVTHNMQQAARVSDVTAFMTVDASRAGTLVEVGPTARIFTNPQDQRTEDYITGRVG